MQESVCLIIYGMEQEKRSESNSLLQQWQFFILITFRTVRNYHFVRHARYKFI